MDDRPGPRILVAAEAKGGHRGSERGGAVRVTSGARIGAPRQRRVHPGTQEPHLGSGMRRVARKTGRALDLDSAVAAFLSIAAPRVARDALLRRLSAVRGVAGQALDLGMASHRGVTG